ncbi:MAG: hypothetical protein ACR2KJ_11220 [Jatrophihabitans sp.]
MTVNLERLRTDIVHRLRTQARAQLGDPEAADALRELRSPTPDELRYTADTLADADKQLRAEARLKALQGDTRIRDILRRLDEGNT